MTLTFSWLQIFKPTGIYPHHGWDPCIDLEAMKYWPRRRKSPRRVAKMKEIFHAAVYKEKETDWSQSRAVLFKAILGATLNWTKRLRIWKAEGWDFETVLLSVRRRLSLCVGASGDAGGESRHPQVNMCWLASIAVFLRTLCQGSAQIPKDQQTPMCLGRIYICRF